MASYNHENFVGESIESVLKQTGCDFELIIVDDGSTDGTVKEIKKFKDPRITLHCLEKNQGACIALNQAIQMGRGEYVAILNSDDAFLPDKLRIQEIFLKAHPEVQALFALPQFVDDRGMQLSPGTNISAEKSLANATARAKNGLTIFFITEMPYATPL